MSGLTSLQEIDLTGNPVSNVEQVVDALLSIGPQLTALSINLYEEDQVDYLLRTLANL